MTRRGVLSALALAVLALAACGGDGSPVAPRPTPSAPATPAKPTATVTPERTATPVPSPSPSPTASATATPSPTATATAPPTAPPPPEPPTASAEWRATCANDEAVPDTANNAGLVDDCAILLEARDILAGDGAPPDWSADRPMAEWSGVAVEGEPPRVTALRARGFDLRGRIPPALAGLTQLRRLDLGGNLLTGGVPPELGRLPLLRLLDLRDNELGGAIPEELDGITVGEFAWFDGEGLWLSGNDWTGCLPIALRHFVSARFHGSSSDLRHLGLPWCQCPPPRADEPPSAEPYAGRDGIPHLPPYATIAPGTWRLTFSIVLDVPEGGAFELWERLPGNDGDGDTTAMLHERESGSVLSLNPFTGEEYGRAAIDVPAHCGPSVSDLFDAIAASAREQPPYPPPDRADIRDIGDSLDGDNSYWLDESRSFSFDVPDGARLTPQWSGVCVDPGRCYGFLVLVDEETGSRLALDTDTGERSGWESEITAEGRARGVDALFDRIAASVRQHPPERR